MPRAGQPGGLSDELDPYVDRAEADRFDRVGDLLRSQQPTPRADLLTAVARERVAAEGLWTQVAASLAIGLALLGLALLGASGSGPLGG
jgi:hypothetical protein